MPDQQLEGDRRRVRHDPTAARHIQEAQAERRRRAEATAQDESGWASIGHDKDEAYLEHDGNISHHPDVASPHASDMSPQSPAAMAAEASLDQDDVDAHALVLSLTPMLKSG